MRCRVVTWNVHSCVGRDGRHDPARVAEVLASLRADVIGLQEVDWRLPTEHEGGQLEALTVRLGMTALEGKNLRDHRGELGNALLTRLHVERVRRVSLSETGREPRGAIDARLRGAGGSLRALVTHLGLRRGERLRQVERLRAVLAEGGWSTTRTPDAGPATPPAPDPPRPTVLMGDLNEWRPRRLAPSLLVPDPFPEVASGRTYPSRLPLFSLDRILVRPAPALRSFEVVRTSAARAASDHLPLVADLVW